MPCQDEQPAIWINKCFSEVLNLSAQNKICPKQNLFQRWLEFKVDYAPRSHL